MRIRSSRKWLKSIRKKFRRSSHSRDIVYSYTVPSPNEEELIIYEEEEDDEETHHQPPKQKDDDGNHREVEEFKGKEEDAVILAAAIKIQATFRAHLARRAFKALRSLVKLQALARGAYVRKQTQLALHCMHALVRLQVRVRTRQLLGSFDV